MLNPATLSESRFRSRCQFKQFKIYTLQKILASIVYSVIKKNKTLTQLIE